MTTSTTGQRILLFGVFSALVLTGVVAYALHARAKAKQAALATAPVEVLTDSTKLATVRREPHLLFRNIALGTSYGTIAIVPLDAPAGPRLATPLRGERVHGAPDGSGIYLNATRRALTTYEAVSFSRDLKPLHTFKLAGAPSRTRVSPDGHRAASTVFVSGDSYNVGGFSTRTTIYDLNTANIIADLEEFVIQKDGRPFKEMDFNFWGVTIAADGDRFYATLASGDIPYLIEGRISQRQARVLRAGVECPSLSPDGSQLVFKSRYSENGRRVWRLHVLNLKTQKETIVSETRNVDDQAEWLDADRVLYALPRPAPDIGRSDIWVVRSDGTGEPRLFVKDATSPCVVRP